MQTHHEVVRSAKRLIILYLGKHLILTLEVHVGHGSFMIENWRYHDGHLQAQAFIAELTEPTRYHLQDRSNGCRARDILDVNDIFQGHVYGRSLVVNGACLAHSGAVAWLAAVCVAAQLCSTARMTLRATLWLEL